MVDTKKFMSFKSPKGSRVYKKRDTLDIGISDVDVTVSKSLESSKRGNSSSDFTIDEENDYNSDNSQNALSNVAGFGPCFKKKSEQNLGLSGKKKLSITLNSVSPRGDG